MQTNIRSYRWLTACGATLMALLAWPSPAAAQLDPLLFLKGNQPNVIVAVDVSNRMQRDAPTDPANPRTTSNYYDPWIYTGSAISATQQAELGLVGNITTQYRRKYVGLDYTSNINADRFTTTTIAGVGDKVASFASFETPTRMSLARGAVASLSVMLNLDVCRPRESGDP